MADESPSAEEVEASKSRGWNKLRGKIFDKENKLSTKLKRHHGHSDDHDVDDFLRPNAGPASNTGTAVAPKLDISAAKSHGGPQNSETDFIDSTSARIEGVGGVPSYAPTREDMSSGKWRPTKPARRPGLRVLFSDKPEETIGEGGDEAEEATAAIGQRARRARRVAEEDHPANNEQAKLVYRDQAMQNKRLQRTPTSLAESQGVTSATASSSRVYEDRYRPPHGASQNYTIPRKPSVPAPRAPTTGQSSRYEEDAPIRPLRRAPTGLDEAREHRQQAGDVSAELHIDSPETPPSSRSQQGTYEQQMQQILTQSYAQPGHSSKEVSPASKSQRKASNTPQWETEHGSPHPPRPSLRTRGSPPGRSPIREPRPHDPPYPEIRSPVDSTNMRKMRAEEGLTHRNSVQGVQGLPAGGDSVVAALAKLSPGLEAPAPYAQGRSSFDSIRSGSEHSRYSNSPEPSSGMGHGVRQSASSIDGAQYLSPPSSSHGLSPRFDISQRHSLGSNENLVRQHLPRSTSEYSSRQRGRSTSDNSPEAISGPSAAHSPNQHASYPQGLVIDPNIEEAFSHFASAVSSIFSLFRLSAEAMGVRPTAFDWMRCGLWWFLKGKEGIEEMVRSEAHQAADRQSHLKASNSHCLPQHHINLAKSLWILNDIIPNCLSDAQANARSVPPTQNIDAIHTACEDLANALKYCCFSMRRHNILPSPQEQLVHGLDSGIWIKTPCDRLPPDWQWVLNGKVFAPPRQASEVFPLFAIPLHDDAVTFCYGRVFVSITVSMGDDKPFVEPFECILSFTRGKTSAEAEIVLSSQLNDVNIHVKAAGEHGVHWEHTKFDSSDRSLRIKLPQKLRLRVFLSPRDYSFLASFVENSQRTSQSLNPRKNERLLQTITLRSFHYRDSLHPDEFPSNAVGLCKATLFEQVVRPERNRRKVHAGFRFAVVNLEKTVRSVNISFGKSAPLEYNISTSQPTLQFQLNEAGRRRSAHIVFDNFQHRDLFRDVVSGTVLGPQEIVLCHVPVSSIAFSRAASSNLAPAILRWGSVQLIDENDPDDPQHLSSSADVSENLRVMVYSKSGSVVDRLNDAMVDLKIRLEPTFSPQLQIYRSSGRHDITISIGPDPSETNELRNIFDVTTSGPHLSAYTFSSLKDLHMFQKAVTGFKVIYDGVASSFSIPRRKPGSVIAKHLESTDARVQIIERERVLQLIAFFRDYVLADSMNFELKRTDQFDKTDSKTLGPGVKVVDAKFVLPGSNKDDPIKDGAIRDASARFTAFDTHEYAAEHDDITISFKSEQERDAFAEALPAPVSSGKKFTLRRKI